MKLKIYTRTGDQGKTSLYGGKRVSKSNQRVCAYGTVDELNSLLGMVCTQLSDKKVKPVVLRIQHDLFTIGASLAGSEITLEHLKKRVEEIELQIDSFDQELPQLKNFILPGGMLCGALFHFARSVCRRAEREVIALSQEESVNSVIIVYLNRLSDFLFVCARYVNQKQSLEETIWKRT